MNQMQIEGFQQVDEQIERQVRLCVEWIKRHAIELKDLLADPATYNEEEIFDKFLDDTITMRANAISKLQSEILHLRQVQRTFKAIEAGQELGRDELRWLR